MLLEFENFVSDKHDLISVLFFRKYHTHHQTNKMIRRIISTLLWRVTYARKHLRPQPSGSGTHRPTNLQARCQLSRGNVVEYVDPQFLRLRTSYILLTEFFLNCRMEITISQIPAQNTFLTWDANSVKRYTPRRQNGSDISKVRIPTSS